MSIIQNEGILFIKYIVELNNCGIKLKDFETHFNLKKNPNRIIHLLRHLRNKYNILVGKHNGLVYIDNDSSLVYNVSPPPNDIFFLSGGRNITKYPLSTRFNDHELNQFKILIDNYKHFVNIYDYNDFKRLYMNIKHDSSVIDYLVDVKFDDFKGIVKNILK